MNDRLIPALDKLAAAVDSLSPSQRLAFSLHTKPLQEPYADATNVLRTLVIADPVLRDLVDQILVEAVAAIPAPDRKILIKVIFDNNYPPAQAIWDTFAAVVAAVDEE